MIRALFLSLLCSGLVCSTLAQVTVSPTFPKDTDSITVTFDATQGNKALKDLGPPIVYMHAGVITDKSTSSTDWKYVQGNWGTADNKVLMNYQGNNIYQKKYHIRNFYGVPGGEKILRLAFVFRNVDGSKVGRTADGSDIFVEISQEDFALKITSPTEREMIISKGAFLDIKAECSDTGIIQLFHDQKLVTEVKGDSILEYLLQANAEGNHVVHVVASSGANISNDSFLYVVNPNRALEDPMVTMDDGVTFPDANTTRFTLYAPQKSYVYLVGDFNNWKLDTGYLMYKTTDNNRFWLDVKGLEKGVEYAYQYYIDGSLKVADPFSIKVLDPWNDHYIDANTYPKLKAYPAGKTTDIVSCFTAHPSAYAWKNKNFKPADRADLVIYEMLIRDFVATHNYQTLTDTLDYLVKLGVNAIELMPVTEFEGNESWGYNVSFHMALDKYYGTPEAFKAFVDACHAKGIAVLLDVVYNHAFSQSPLCKMYWDAANSRPSADNPYMNVTDKHPFGVGYDVNHESKASQYWMDRCNKYWIEEFHVDGFRFDMSKGFTQKNTGSDIGAWGQYDASRVGLLKRMSDVVRSVKSDAVIILEHFADNNEEKELGAYGFLLWNNFNHQFSEASMGYPSDLSWSSYKASGHNKPDWVVYMESHDEERVMFKNISYGNTNGSYNIKDKTTAIERMKLSSCFFYGVPGPKMLWQFGELGYDVSIEFNGRLGNKPIRWNYLQEAPRKELFQLTSELIHLKTNYPTFKTDNFNLYTTGMGKIIQLNHSEMDALILGNFDVRLMDLDPNFPHSGWWYEYFSGDSINVTDTRARMAFDPGEYRLYTTKKIDRPKLSGIEDFKPTASNGLFRIAPNPSQDRFYFINKSNVPWHGRLLLIDLTGKVVYETDIAAQSNGQTVDISADVLPGLYQIIVEMADGRLFTERHLITR